jgi:hypothetical protein
MAQVGDKVKVKATGQEGFIKCSPLAQAGGTFDYGVLLPGEWTLTPCNEGDIIPVTATVLEGKVWIRLEGTLVGETWLENTLRPHQNKRVRLTIEVIED